MHIGQQFRQLRKRTGKTQAGAAKLLHCSVRSLGEFERTGAAPTVVPRAMDLMDEWKREVGLPRTTRDEPVIPYGGGLAPGVVRVQDLTEPLPVLIGGLLNTVALLRDETIPLRARLVHTKVQLQFVMDNFLGDASLPVEPEGGAGA